MATKEDIRGFREDMTTRDDIRGEREKMATRAHLRQLQDDVSATPTASWFPGRSLRSHTGGGQRRVVCKGNRVGVPQRPHERRGDA